MVRADKIRRLMTKRHVALGLRTVRKKRGRPAGELYDTYCDEADVDSCSVRFHFLIHSVKGSGRCSERGFLCRAFISAIPVSILPICSCASASSIGSAWSANLTACQGSRTYSGWQPRCFRCFRMAAAMKASCSKVSGGPANDQGQDHVRDTGSQKRTLRRCDLRPEIRHVAEGRGGRAVRERTVQNGL